MLRPHDARRIAMGGVGTTENIASQAVQEERGYRAIVFPFGLFQVAPHWEVFNPTGMSSIRFARSNMPRARSITRSAANPATPQNLVRHL